MSSFEKDGVLENTSQTKKNISLKQKVTIIIAVTLIITLIAFVSQNFNKIRIEFLMFEFQVRIIYLMIFSTLVGVVGTIAFQKYRSVKKRKK